jgi:hypothetical protein
VHPPEHVVAVRQLLEWAGASARSPKEQALKLALRELLDPSRLTD